MAIAWFFPPGAIKNAQRSILQYCRGEKLAFQQRSGNIHINSFVRFLFLSCENTFFFSFNWPLCLISGSWWFFFSNHDRWKYNICVWECNFITWTFTSKYKNPVPSFLMSVLTVLKHWEVYFQSGVEQWVEWGGKL